MGRVITRVALMGPVCCGQNQGTLVREDVMEVKDLVGGSAPEPGCSPLSTSVTLYQYQRYFSISTGSSSFPGFAHSAPASFLILQVPSEKMLLW